MYLFLSSRGSAKVSPAPHPRLLEYTRLNFFWKEFGLNKLDMENLCSEWLDEIYAVHMGISRVKGDQATSASSMPPTGKRKGFMSEKLI